MARAWHLIERPTGMPTPANFALRDEPEAPLQPGMVRVRNRWLSVDPYMRGRMNAGKSYIPAFELDQPMTGGAVGAVIESAAPELQVGDRVQHMLGWREEAVAPAAQFRKLPTLDVPEQTFLGNLGGTGMTAYFGLLEAAEAKAGDTVFVSAAAGAVGSAVVQIAKLKGMRVIGSAGGAEKVALVTALGADAAIDYKADGSLADKLRAAAPEGIDLFFDNVGGDHLDAALGLARDGARFALCGAIEGYNNAGGEATPMRNLFRIITNRIRMRGFLVTEFLPQAGRFFAEAAPWVVSGELRSEETVHDGIEAAPDAFLALFSGGNRGKMLVRLG